jgi:hypothetical protein
MTNRFGAHRRVPAHSETTSKYGGADLKSRDREGESRVKVTIEPVKVWPVDMRG